MPKFQCRPLQANPEGERGMSIHLIKLCLVKVSYVSGRCKKILEKQALVAGTKQSRQAVKQTD